MPDNVVPFRRNWWDSFVNLLAGLGVPGRDKMMSQQFVFTPLTYADCQTAFRSDWIARKVVEIPAFDMTRAWRAWEAEESQVEQLEGCEKALFVQRRVQDGLIKARLYGGAALIIGVDSGQPSEPLNLDNVGKDGLQFLHVVTPLEISYGPIIWDVLSPWYGLPAWYMARSQMPERPPTTPASAYEPGLDVQIHPSRVVRLVGLDNGVPLSMSATPWGDSVLQPLNDLVKMCGMVTGSLATLVSELKLDIIKVPELTELLSTESGTSKLVDRFARANAAKSVINTVLLDSGEEWERVNANFAGADRLLMTYLQLASGAADIPATRFLGRTPGALGSTGESDIRNYYDMLSSRQSVMLTPAMNILDEVIIRSALGDRPPEVTYTWNSLWQTSDKEKAEIALAKAQTYKIHADEGQIPAVALAQGLINQLLEDGVYPGLDQALDDAAEQGETIEEVNLPAPTPPPAVPGAPPVPGPQPGPPHIPGQPKPGGESAPSGGIPGLSSPQPE